MMREDTIRMVREVGLDQIPLPPDEAIMLFESIERFAALVAAKEREACAKLCLEEAPSIDGELCAAAIRARGK